MTPLQLKLVNFIGIRDGLGLAEISLDLAALTGGAALVALRGPNGAGKSTILDNLTPYRLMASRASSYSPAAFSYYDHVYGTAAEKELVWQHNGKRYRTSLVFKMPGKTRKTEAYLQVYENNQWVPVQLPDGTVSDGKADTYDRCVEFLLGTPELFFTSAFSAQNRRPLSSYANSEIKALMSELLALEDVRQAGEKAAEVVKTLEVHLDAMRSETRGDSDVADRLVAANATLSQATRMAENGKNDRDARRRDLQAAEKALAAQEALASHSDKVEADHKRLDEREQAVKVELNREIRQVEQDRQQDLAEKGKSAAAHQTARARLNRSIADTRERLDRIGGVLAREQDIREAGSRLQVITVELEQVNATLPSMREQKEKLITTRGELSTLASQREALNKELAITKKSCNTLREEAKLAAIVPCAETDLQAQCPLMKKALGARSLIEEQESLSAKTDEECAKLDRAIQSHRELVASLETLTASMAQTEQRQSQLQQEHATLVTLASQVDVLEAAVSEQPVRAQELEELQSDIEKLNKEDIEAREAADVRIQQLNERETEARNRAQAALETLARERAALPLPDEAALVSARDAVSRAERALRDSEASLDAASVEIVNAKSRIASLQLEKDRLASAKARIDVVQQELGHWTLLAQALGNNGIIALSIDDAGPSIAAIANDLLLACYGPRFTIAIETQSTTRQGKQKETFDVRVFDATSGESKSVKDMSGGEKIWIQEALARAIALFQSQHSGQHYGTLFADESDGALDPDRKEMYMRMKKQVHQIGGYGQEFFISHTPELWNMADAVIDLGDYSSTN